VNYRRNWEERKCIRYLINEGICLLFYDLKVTTTLTMPVYDEKWDLPSLGPAPTSELRLHEIKEHLKFIQRKKLGCYIVKCMYQTCR